MNSYICLLRGVNVSGQHIIPMSNLRAMLSDSGFSEIRTYIQSGNVVLASTMNDPARIARMIEASILASFEFQIPVLVRTKAELEDILERDPYLKQKATDKAKVYYTFLSRQPDSNAIAALNEFSAGTDKCFATGKEVFIYCPGGYGNTKLSNSLIEKKLGVTATTRNLKTVKQLINMADDK